MGIKSKTGLDKANQSFGKDITRMAEYSTRITKSNKFIQMLLHEGRVSKEELVPFFPKKKIVESKFDDQAPTIKYKH